MRVRSLPAFFALAAATVLLSSCSARLPDPATAVRAAVKNASDARTVHMQTDAYLEGLPRTDAYTSHAIAAWDFENGRFFVRGREAGVEGEIRGFPQGVYIRQPGEDRWLLLEADPAESGQGESEFEDLFFGGGDPLKVLKAFGAAEAHVKRAGEDTVRGRESDRYVAAVPRSELDLTEVRITGLAGDEVFYEFWVYKSDRLPARLRISFEADMTLLPEIDAPGPLRLIWTMEFFDYGKPVVVEEPPADQVDEAAWEEVLRELIKEIEKDETAPSPP